MWTGTVNSGGGNASKHMLEPDDLAPQFREFGYTPVPGTLNIEVDTKTLRQVRALPYVTEWSARGRHRFWPVYLNGFPCHVKQWTNRLEAVAPVKLRDHLGLSNGDTVELAPRVSVSATIMAHPKREAWATELADILGCDITWDERNNVWDTASRAWANHDPHATHHVVIQDDAIVGPRLLDHAERIATTVGCAPVSLTAIGYRIAKWRERYDAADRYWKTDRGVSAVALMLPVCDIPKMLRECEQSKVVHDDVRLMMWYRKQGRPFLVTKPSLVDHRNVHENPTLVPGNDAEWDDRSAVNFDPDPHVDWTVDVKPSEVAPMVAHGTEQFVNVRSRKVTTVQIGTKGWEHLSRQAERGKVWRRLEPAEAHQNLPAPVVETPRPPVAGPGSGRDVWAAYAASKGVTVDPSDSRADIIAKVG